MLKARDQGAMEELMDVTSGGSRNNGRIDGSCKHFIRERWNEPDRWSKRWIREQGTERWMMQDWTREQLTVILCN